MDTIWAYETASRRRYIRASGQGWTRKAHFDNVPAATLDDLIPDEFSVYPDEDDDHSASRLFRVDTQIGLREDIWSVDLFYRPRTWMEYLTSNPNHGVMFQNSRMVSRPMRYDHEGNILLGPDPTDATGRTQYELVEGSGLEDDYLATVEVVGVVNSSGQYTAYTQYVDSVGSWNSASLSGFPKAGIGIWRLVELSSEPMATAGQLWTVRAIFELNPDGWDTETVSRKMVLETREMPVYDADGEVGGEDSIGTKRVTLLVPSPVEVFRYGGYTNSAQFVGITSLLSGSW